MTVVEQIYKDIEITFGIHDPVRKYFESRKGEWLEKEQQQLEKAWRVEPPEQELVGKPNELMTEPKPITPEMLEAYGFEKNDMGEGEAYYSLRLSDERYCDLALITGDKNGFMEVCLFPYEDFFRVRYEHQMLAMYKGITGKDLVAKIGNIWDKLPIICNLQIKNHERI